VAILPGVAADGDLLPAWLDQHVPGCVPPFSAEQLAGGRSNLTYRITDRTGRRLVLRRPPFGPLLESAHDMVREYRIQHALVDTPVPVAPLLGLCRDSSILGAPFYVMEFVDGAVLRDAQTVEASFGPEERSRVGDALIDCLAELHGVSLDGVGLADLGQRDNYVIRQIRRWRRQWDAVKQRELPVIDEVARRLAQAAPEQRRTALVHGDFRLDNCIIGTDCSVQAVLDWELCALGDPLADLGMLMVYWPRPGDVAPRHLAAPPTDLDGFRERAELVDRYVARTGADVSELGFFQALGYWKLACIFEGIRVRYAAGVMADDATTAEPYGVQAVELAEAALRLTEEFGRGGLERRPKPPAQS
jgi:aminoglycoside phosphotransferase (APT) family kinase protein